MKIDFLSLFPEVFGAYCSASILKRAQERGAVTCRAHQLRDFSTDKHGNVDDTPYGGGAGMVMQVEPIFRALHHMRERVAPQEHVRTILLSAKGKTFTQRDAKRLAAYDRLIFVCGRYEGVDERVAEHIVDEELAIGDYVLTGGELGALVIADSVVRLLPGVLGNEESAVYESYSTDGYREHPHYTKPEDFNGWRVPEVLLSGDHAAIAGWREKHAVHADNQKKE